uniref:Si:dkey-25g12.4 n=1 Tax=Xiphophorus couchianus TaxID=32473 RepID=A0A3B5KYG5_9TELE
MAASPRITARLPPTKTVTVYRNGDAFYPGKKVVMNPRHLSTFDNFMNTLTRHMEAPFGAVRRLYTPTKGHSVQELDQLKHGGSYVAAGKEPFKVLNYCGIATIEPQKRKNNLIKPVPHTRVVASARWRKIRDGTCTINVFSNGELRIPPARVRIPKHTLKSWDRVLSMVTHKVELRTGAVYKLCRLDGRPVSCSAELENNQHYVAVGPEKFKPLPYERIWVQKREKCRQRAENNIRFSPYWSDLALKLMLNSKLAKSQHIFPVIITINNNVEDAAEVQEDPHLKVDLPIDQVRHNPTQPPPNDLESHVSFSFHFAVVLYSLLVCFYVRHSVYHGGSHVFPSEQVEAKTVEEEHEASTSTANRKSSDATRPKKTKAAGYKKHVSTLYNKFYVVLSHIQFIFTSLLCPIFSFALELGHRKMA